MMAFKIKQIQEEKLRLQKEEEEKRALSQANLIDRAGTPSQKSDIALEDRSKMISPHPEMNKSIIAGGLSTAKLSFFPGDKEKIDNDFKPVIMLKLQAPDEEDFQKLKTAQRTNLHTQIRNPQEVFGLSSQCRWQASNS
jgi:hypothetical protein